MGTPGPPAFTDPALEAAVEAARRALEERIRRLDLISADIKALEAYLNECGVRWVIGVPIPGGGIDEELRWEMAEPDRWRLTYHRRDAQGDYARALLETKADVRIRAMDALPDLVRNLGAAAEADG